MDRTWSTTKSNLLLTECRNWMQSLFVVLYHKTLNSISTWIPLVNSFLMYKVQLLKMYQGCKPSNLIVCEVLIFSNSIISITSKGTMGHFYWVSIPVFLSKLAYFSSWSKFGHYAFKFYPEPWWADCRAEAGPSMMVGLESTKLVLNCCPELTVISLDSWCQCLWM